jgi:hypothetical protein
VWRPFLSSCFTLAICAAAVAQEAAPAANPFADELERRQQQRALQQVFEEHDIQGQMFEAALECAALAFRFDRAEHERLLRLGYMEGQSLMASLLTAAFEVDVESIPWTETPFRGLRELIAFQLGQTYGKTEDKFFREIPYGGSAESWEAAYKREYEARNCALIGR